MKLHRTATTLSVRLIVMVMALSAYMPTSEAVAVSIGPSPYLSFADSPFNGGSFSYFHLETFEDHLLNTPGVTASPRRSDERSFWTFHSRFGRCG